MDGLRQWGIGLCAACLVAAIANQLVVQGRLQKIYRVVLSVFFLACLFSPLLVQNGTLRFSISDSSETLMQQTADALEEQQQLMATQLAVANIQTVVGSFLEQQGVTAQEITVQLEQHEDQLQITGITVLLPQEYQPEQARLQSLLQEQFALPFTMVYP